MQLQTLQLINFKNYAAIKLDLSPRINVLVGKNGSGKTNFLDAIHYLSLTRSAFHSIDQYCIKHQEGFFTIKGKFKQGKSFQDVLCSVQTGLKKIFKEGSNDYQKLSEHVGKYPVVLIAPDDTDIIKEGSEERRKFFDSIISQLHKPYLEALIQYNHALKQRNSALKMFAEANKTDEVMIESYDQILIHYGENIFEQRKQFVGEFLPYFQKYYNYIVEEEKAGLVYATEVNKISYAEGLQRNKQKDLFLQRTNFGIHRDDYQFTLGEGDLRRLGSQGQQKSFVIALKLAQFEIIKNHKGFKPILLLDDIFDKLDDFRIERFLDLIRQDELGQLFITDARPDRTAKLLQNINVPATIFTVTNGEIKQYEQRE
jgi:DNA replication and repair protein RecF